MSKTSRQKPIQVPKLLTSRKEISPYNKGKELKHSSNKSKINLESKSKLKRILQRGKTLVDNNYIEGDLACLVTVERHYIREMLSTPLRCNSKSPITSKKATKNVSPVKATKGCHQFETLTACDFLYSTNKKLITKRNRSAITPDCFLKRK